MGELQDGEYTAVVDSIEDELATVFFERDGESLGGLFYFVLNVEPAAQ